MTTAIDTNVLIDLIDENIDRRAVATQRLDEAAAAGSLIICEPVYEELVANFHSPERLDNFLIDMNIALQPSSRAVLFQAGRAWLAYTRRKPLGIICSVCGAETQARCSRCEAAILLRQRVMNDFLIGAHAWEYAGRLLTHDRGYYPTYFPDLELA